ncbi:MAG: thiosulfate oxidation carrier complex protein SoxZ [Gammaproteobacteria bacterium]|nr:thiosulfate oxidation carrier complex protein SoxZ [Gammaproteobacteria bacterium]MCZ6894030.1 thiosulfate oxidation carrier complex protein SoxZ [Gammaproteobacteria bacterium]
MAKARVKISKKIKKGEPFQVKTLISHKMESGQRKNEETGENFPRKIINTFICKLDGEEVFRAKLYPAVSANPFLSFYVTAEKSGELEFIWIDDDGTETQYKKSFEVPA